MQAEEPKYIHRENPETTQSSVVLLNRAGWLEVAPARQGITEMTLGFVSSLTPALPQS